MHNRNIYKTPPDFKQLSVSYPEFRQHVTQDITGRISIDFKNPATLRALTRALLHKDFSLNIEIPADNLIPTVPQRLNYILWVEDLLALLNIIADAKLIDIGTGSTCIFPLLGATKGWTFLASESNEAAVEYAQKNVHNNSFGEKIKVVQVQREAMLLELVDDGLEYDISMCNPPFYSDATDSKWDKKSRTKRRPEPNGCNSANNDEKIVEGGEVEFVKRMIKDSLQLKTKIRIYTTMLGKKKSINSIKNEFKANKITHFSVTEFIQGKTTRWGVAWTFLNNINLNEAEHQKKCGKKARNPITYFIPSNIKDMEYTMKGVSERVIRWLDELKFEKKLLVQTESLISLQIKSKANTWSHQRRKRREMLKNSCYDNDNQQPSTSNGDTRKRKAEEMDKEITNDYILIAALNLKLAGSNLVLEMDSDNKDVLYQVMQFFKNKLEA